MDSTDGLSRGYEVVGTGIYPNADWRERIRSFIQCSGDAIDGLGNLQKQEKTECQFTVKLKFEDLSTSSEVLFTGISDLMSLTQKG
jgi:F-type H+-transporting ATPase subunit beta